MGGIDWSRRGNIWFYFPVDISYGKVQDQFWKTSGGSVCSPAEGLSRHLWVQQGGVSSLDSVTTQPWGPAFWDSCFWAQSVEDLLGIATSIRRGSRAWRGAEGRVSERVWRSAVERAILGWARRNIPSSATYWEIKEMKKISPCLLFSS